MDLESLKKRNAANITGVQLGDVAVSLRKLSVTDGFAVGKTLLTLGHDNPEGAEPTQDQFFEFHVLLLSKTICDKDGLLTLDSDDGRAELRNLSYWDAKALGEKAQEWSGLLGDDSKKN